jgi:hypothetical protein
MLYSPLFEKLRFFFYYGLILVTLGDFITTYICLQLGYFEKTPTMIPIVNNTILFVIVKAVAILFVILVTDRWVKYLMKKNDDIKFFQGVILLTLIFIFLVTARAVILNSLLIMGGPNSI